MCSLSLIPSVSITFKRRRGWPGYDSVVYANKVSRQRPRSRRLAELIKHGASNRLGDLVPQVHIQTQTQTYLFIQDCRKSRGTTYLSCAPVSRGLNRGGSKVKVKG